MIVSSSSSSSFMMMRMIRTSSRAYSKRTTIIRKQPQLQQQQQQQQQQLLRHEQSSLSSSSLPSFCGRKITTTTPCRNNHSTIASRRRVQQQQQQQQQRRRIQTTQQQQQQQQQQQLHHHHHHHHYRPYHLFPGMKRNNGRTVFLTGSSTIVLFAASLYYFYDHSDHPSIALAEASSSSSSPSSSSSSSSSPSSSSSSSSSSPSSSSSSSSDAERNDKNDKTKTTHDDDHDNHHNNDNKDEDGMVSWMSRMLFGDNKKQPQQQQPQEQQPQQQQPQEQQPQEQQVDTLSSHSDGPGKKVIVEIDEEVLEELPIMKLQDVRNCNHHPNPNNQRLLVTYDGIVYDVTEFIHDHPGGKELLLTAIGLDLEYFFHQYVVHGNTNKAGQWLAPLAVGKLSKEETQLAKQQTNSDIHVQTRMKLLQKKRNRIILVASTLPFWITIRTIIRFIGYCIPPLGRLMARLVPVTVPGYSPGTEPLVVQPPKYKQNQQNQQEQNQQNQQNQQDKEKPYSVAIIGGGIAGCGAAWALARSGQFHVTLYEARETISGNAKTFDWDFSLYRKHLPKEQQTVKSCVSVTAWPPIYYKNYTALLETLNIETVHQPLSWFIHSKVPGYEGILWEADPDPNHSSLRTIFQKDFQKYKFVLDVTKQVTNLFTLKWAPWRWNDSDSMYDTHQGFGLFNPLCVIPLYTLFKWVGGSDPWWDIIFTPQYTASFLVDELRPFPAVFGPLIEAQIPLLPNRTNSWQGSSKRSNTDCNITTCVTWKEAGKGIRNVFHQLVKPVSSVKTNTRVLKVEVLPNGKKRIYDEYDTTIDVDRVVFACPANAIGNILTTPTTNNNTFLTDTILSTIVYADDHHPTTGHMHAVMHNDATVIDSSYREECLKRASNYVEVTQVQPQPQQPQEDQQPQQTSTNPNIHHHRHCKNKKLHHHLNIENQYNFGVQTPGPGIYDLSLDEKPVMLISHALGDGKVIDRHKIQGMGNHARAHPLYSGWNVAAQLSLRLIQGRYGIYYCSNWTTPGNCHDMSFLSGLICAHAIGAPYPFPQYIEAKKDFYRLRDLMGI